MPRGLFIVAAAFAANAAAVGALTLAACNSPEHDAVVRYYVPPPDDAAGGSTSPTGTGTTSSPTIGDGGPTDGAAGEGGEASDAGLSLALAGWWRAPFAAPPWVGTASAGVSAAQNLATGTTAPMPGAALGGLATADFNGSSNFLVGATLSTFQSTTTFSGWALVNVDAIHTNSVTWSLNDAIFCSSATGELGVFLRDDGAAQVSVGLASFSGVDHTVLTPIVKNAWQLVQWRSSGTTMSIRVNGGAWASTDTVAGVALTTPLELGRNPAQTTFFDGRMADVGLTTAMLADADFDKVRAYASARYALTL